MNLGFNDIATSTSLEANVLDVVFSTASVETDVTIPFGLKHIALRRIDDHYSLGVYVDGSAVEQSDSIGIEGKRFRIKQSGESNALVVRDMATIKTPHSTASIGGIELAMNVSKHLILTQVAGSVWMEDVAHIGDKALRIVRIADKWYLTVTLA